MHHDAAFLQWDGKFGESECLVRVQAAAAREMLAIEQLRGHHLGRLG